MKAVKLEQIVEPSEKELLVARAFLQRLIPKSVLRFSVDGCINLIYLGCGISHVAPTIEFVLKVDKTMLIPSKERERARRCWDPTIFVSYGK